ncbi:hypothetical protein SteCoe_34499 [Stentor coeruleus]|uniref:SAM domain-containing protein n=1 Tax=Stentor coeruleus TaxID=5963 RepID=A0A1R2AUD6_9CILI|nr:hypothetical protein SteCoe_34499 [Stentor coeruleus]
MIQYNISSISRRPTETSVVEITDIHKACRTGDLETIKRAFHVDPSKVNTKDESLGWTPLFRTVIFGHVKATKFLLKHGSNPDLVNSLGETPLHQAADNSQYIIAELLLQYKADPNKQQNDGDTPLHHAAFRGDSKMIEILLRHGGDCNIKNSLFGRTPLHFACDCEHEECVLLMLQYKADAHMFDSQGKTPFQLANPNIQNTIENFSMLGTVIVHESPIHTQSNQESAPDLPVTALSKWLENLSLADYYQNFISYEYDDLETLLTQMQSVIPISLQELKRLGIDKIGHRYRILIKLEEDSGIFPPKTLSKNNWQCCGVPRKTQFGFLTVTLDAWLEGLKLLELKENFMNNGFDEFQFIATQMKSRYPLNDEILEEIGITKPGHRNRIIGNLIEEAKDRPGIIVENSQNMTSCEMCRAF